MKVITAPDDTFYSGASIYKTVFLAGGITNCRNWQAEVIENLENILARRNTDSLLIFNPRRDIFPIDDPNASYEQIKWEHDKLNKCSIFSMYFCNSENVQPICMYELGHYIPIKRFIYGEGHKCRTVVSVEKGYSRENDVVIQCELEGIQVFTNATPETHALMIAKAWNDIGILGGTK